MARRRLQRADVRCSCSPQEIETTDASGPRLLPPRRARARVALGDRRRACLARRLTGRSRDGDTARSIAGGDLRARVDGRRSRTTSSPTSPHAQRDGRAARAPRGMERRSILSVSHDLRHPAHLDPGYAEAMTDGTIEHRHRGRTAAIDGAVRSRREALPARASRRPTSLDLAASTPRTPDHGRRRTRSSTSTVVVERSETVAAVDRATLPTRTRSGDADGALAEVAP